MSEQEVRIKSVVVYFASGHVKEFHNVSDVGLDNTTGIPRMTIHAENGSSETLNLNHVQSYETEVEYLN